MEVCEMAKLTQAVERKAFSAAIDVALKHINKDREKGLLQIVDLAQKFMGDNFQAAAYDGARKMIQNPDQKWMRYVNRLLDENRSACCENDSTEFRLSGSILRNQDDP